MTLLREYRPPRLKGRLDVPYLSEQAAAFLRSIYRLGILGRERVQCWSLVWSTLSRRPTALPLAITLAIYGYHFRTITEAHVQ